MASHEENQTFTGPLAELHVETPMMNENEAKEHRAVAYKLVAGDGVIHLNEAIGKTLTVSFVGVKTCIACGRRVKKLYQNGYCFPCVTTLAECDLCIVKPHECHFHLGTCRDESFGQTHCMIPHYVYLADSSGVKVGLTRKGRQLKRWADQGATSAILLAEVPTRKMAGELEMEVATRLADKTNWRKMLKDTGEADADLTAVRETVIASLGESSQPYVLADTPKVTRFAYPRAAGFEPVLKSLSLDKAPVITSTLQGIKGQYLLLDEGVLNIRKHAGFHVSIDVSERNPAVSGL